MKNETMRRYRTLLTCLMLMFAMVAPSFPGHSLNAAKKTALKTRSAVLAVSEKTSITLSNKVKNAKYTYTSKKPTCAAVDSKGRVTGRKAGKTQIVVRQKLKGKTTKVGTFKVEIKKSKLNEKEIELDLDESINIKELIDYRNKKATYKAVSKDKDIIKATATGKLTAIGEGETNVVINEVIKGKSTTVGTLKVTVYGEEEEDDEDDEDEDDEDDEDDHDNEYEWIEDDEVQ